MRKPLILFALSVSLISAAIIGLSVTTQADAGLRAVESRLAVMPADLNFLMSVDLDGMRRSDIYARFGEEKHREIERKHPELRTFIEETGLDPRRDLDTFLIGSRIGDGESGMVGIVTGRFDPERLQEKLLSERFEQANAAGQVVYRIKTPEADVGHPEISIAFLGREAVVFGTQDGVAQVLTNRQTGNPGFLNADASSDLMVGLDTRAPMFGVIRTGDMANRISEGLSHENVPPALRSLKSVQALTFSVRVSDGIDISSRAVCRTPEDTALVHDAMKGFLAMGKLSAQESDPDIASMLDLAQIHNEGSAVSFSMRIPAEVIDRFHEKMEKLHHEIS